MKRIWDKFIADVAPMVFGYFIITIAWLGAFAIVVWLIKAISTMLGWC